MSRDDASLLDIVNAGKRIQNYVAGQDKASVEANSQARAAVLYEFLVMGEAVKRLSPEFRASHPDVPWSQMAGMRDVLIHGPKRHALQLQPFPVGRIRHAALTRS